MEFSEFFMHKLRTMDFMLSQEELSRRNARRKRNREAAARGREGRMETIASWFGKRREAPAEIIPFHDVRRENKGLARDETRHGPAPHGLRV